MDRSDEQVIADLQAEDSRLRFATFGHTDAWEVGSHLVALARERSQTIAAALWLGEQRVFHAALPGTSADLDSWMDRKVAVVRRYDASSMLIARRWAAHGVTEPLPRFGLDPARFTFSGGAVPIRVGATQVGVAVASGVSDEVEHALVVEALGAVLARTT